jgi:hypothetical protein
MVPLGSDYESTIRISLSKALAAYQGGVAPTSDKFRGYFTGAVKSLVMRKALLMPAREI